MTAVLIEPADLNRLAVEINMAIDAGDGPLAWSAREGISLRALGAVFNSADRSFAKAVGAGDDPFDALTCLLAATFRLAWEAHKEYAGGGA